MQTATALAQSDTTPQISYETLLGGRDGPVVGFTLPMLPDAQQKNGRLQWIDDPELTTVSGPYAQFGVTRGDWVRHVDGRRKQIIVNVQVYGNKDRIMRMAGKTLTANLEVLVKHTAFGSFVLINLYEADERPNTAIELTSSTKQFGEDAGWQSFATAEMAHVRVAVKPL